MPEDNKPTNVVELPVIEVQNADGKTLKLAELEVKKGKGVGKKYRGVHPSETMQNVIEFWGDTPFWNKWLKPALNRFLLVLKNEATEEEKEMKAAGRTTPETNWEMFEQFLIKLSPRGESKAALKTRFFELIDRLSDPDIQSDPVSMAELISDIQSVKAALETKKPEEREEEDNAPVNA